MNSPTSATRRLSFPSWAPFQTCLPGEKVLKRINFQSLVSCGLAGLLVVVFAFFLLFSYQCLKRSCDESTCNKCLRKIGASECSKDQLESSWSIMMSVILSLLIRDDVISPPNPNPNPSHVLLIVVGRECITFFWDGAIHEKCGFHVINLSCIGSLVIFELRKTLSKTGD